MSADGSDSPMNERLVPRIPTLAEQRRIIAERCAERDTWRPSHIYAPEGEGRRGVRKLAP